MSIEDGYRWVADQVLAPRQEAWQKLGHNGYPAQVEPVSAPFVESAKVTYSGPTSGDLLKAAARAEVEATITPLATRIFDWVEEKRRQEGYEVLDLLRSGGVYYAGAYANKQPSQWCNPTWRALMLEHGLVYFMMPEFQEVREEIARLYESAVPRIASVLDRITDKESSEYYIIASKPPNTGVGLVGIRDRQALARFLAKPANHDVILRDVEVYAKGRAEMVRSYPEKATIIEGYTLYKGSLSVSRSDADVVAFKRQGNRVTETIDSKVRMAGISITSPFSNSHAFTRDEQRALYQKISPSSYAPTMSRDAVRHVYELPPVTFKGACELDRVTIDADFGFRWPPPAVEERGNKWHLQDTKEIIKSGADGMVYHGCAHRGATGFILPEKLSGDMFTMSDYTLSINKPIALYAAKRAWHLKGVSIGDDQALSVNADEVPEVLNSPLGPYLRTKGSQGNWVFRHGSYLHFDSPDHAQRFVIPRILKTQTTANVIAKGGNPLDYILKPGQSRIYGVSREAQEAVAATLKAAPEVFFMEGNPKEFGDRILRHDFQSAVKDAIFAGVVDPNVHWLVEDYDEADYSEHR
jgi:hypothetical protein